MGKLPKSMQKNKKQAHSLRTQGTKSINRANQHIPKGVNRQMRRRMQQQGVEGMEQIEATRVIIETPDGNKLVIEDPQVIKVDQQGIEAYQVIGNAETYSSDDFSINQNISEPENEIENEIMEDMTAEINVQITQEDIQLVSMQTGVSLEIAEQELQNTNGDLAKAIINIKTK